jgi:class 3 adenylate cyclase
VEPPETHYATTEDGVSIAYQVVGEGSIDLVFDPAFYGNVDIMWEFAPVGGFLKELSRFSRLVLHDRRGTGLSGRGPDYPNLETRARDLLTVLDACKSSRAALFGMATGGAALALFATTYPDRAASLLWYGPLAKTSWSPDYPWGASPEEQRRFIELIRQNLGTPAFARYYLKASAPSRLGDTALEQEVARLDRHFAAPSTGAEFAQAENETDVTHVLDTLRCPTLLITRSAMLESVEEARFVQDLIPGAELSLVSGDESELFLGEQEPVIDAIRAFLGVRREPVDVDTFLASILFTDIVGSTEKQSSLGDHAWKDLVERHHTIVRECLVRWRGVEIDTAGDGFYATFDGPARAIRCARAIAEAVKPLGIEIRAGIHTGECEIIDGKCGGLAVSIGARVAARSGASEVLISQTVKDLVAGSGFTFEDAGEHELKGVPDRWRLYRVLEPVAGA